MFQTMQIRHPAVAGAFYPASARQLEQTVWRYMDEANIPTLEGVRGVITPHAGYSYSGVIAGHSFKALLSLPTTAYTVYLLGPAHMLAVHGVGLCSAADFETPLGKIHVAVERVEALLALGKPYHLADSAHLPEHCLEVELPFLQVVLPQARIVPMLFDERADPERVGADLAAICAKDPQSLIVVSSDLSHYHFYAEAVRLDESLIDAVLQENAEKVRNGEACGRVAIACLLTVAKRLGWAPHLLAYRTSGEPDEPHTPVVGYASIAFCETSGAARQ